MIPAPFDRSKVPHKSGVYLFKGALDKVIYVGKAIDLFSRVSSYFSEFQVNVKTKALVGEIRDLEVIVVESEIEALILEANLIKKYLPFYNVRLTDDKDYLYIKVTKEEFPKIVTAASNLSTARISSLAYFGPFPSATTVKTTLKRLRRVFPWCANPTGKRPCFYFHLGLCPGPCAGKVNKGEYNQNIKHFIKFMQGGASDLISDLQTEMEEASKKLEFEKAAQLKRALSGVEYLLQPQKAHLYLENPNFLEEQNQKGLVELKQALKMPNIPERIECFDVSNTLGKEATASMVVLTHGEIDKSQYRKFKIKISGRPNDCAMMAEAVRRRLRHQEWSYPDLLLVDGGRGQARAAKLQTTHYKLPTPIYGLAKRMEWVYPPEGEVIKLKKSSLGLRLLQKIRDEAHRFAITYHKKLRSKAFLPQKMV